MADPVGTALGALGLVATTYDTCCRLWNAFDDMQSCGKDIRLLYRELHGQWAQVVIMMSRSPQDYEFTAGPANRHDITIWAVKRQLELLRTYFEQCNDIVRKLFHSGSSRIASATTLSQHSRSPSTTPSKDLKADKSHNSRLQQSTTDLLNVPQKDDRMRPSFFNHLRKVRRHGSQPTKPAALGTNEPKDSSQNTDIDTVPLITIDLDGVDQILSDDDATNRLQKSTNWFGRLTWAHHDKERLQLLVPRIERAVTALRRLLVLKETKSQRHYDLHTIDPFLSVDYLSTISNMNETVNAIRSLHKAVQTVNGRSKKVRRFSISVTPSPTHNMLNLINHDQYLPIRRPGNVLWLQMHHEDGCDLSTLMMLESSKWHDVCWLDAVLRHLLQTPNAMNHVFTTDHLYGYMSFKVEDPNADSHGIHSQARSLASDKEESPKLSRRHTFDVYPGRTDSQNAASGFRAQLQTREGARIGQRTNPVAGLSREDVRDYNQNSERRFVILGEAAASTSGSSEASYDSRPKFATSSRSVSDHSEASNSRDASLHRATGKVVSHHRYLRLFIAQLGNLNRVFVVDDFVGNKRIWMATDQDQSIERVLPLQNKDARLPLMTDISCAHPAVKQKLESPMDHWGLLYDRLQDTYTQVIADKRHWICRTNLSSCLDTDRPAYDMSSTESVLDLAINLLYAQIIWIQLYRTTDMTCKGVNYNDRFEFFEPQDNLGGSSSDCETAKNLCPWLAVGFGETDVPLRPGLQSSQYHDRTVSDNSTAECGLTLWQLGVSLNRSRRFGGFETPEEPQRISRPSVSAALLSMEDVKRGCGHRYAQVVRMCLESKSINTERGFREEATCRAGLRSLLEYRNEMALNSTSHHALPSFARRCDLDHEVMVLM